MTEHGRARHWIAICAGCALLVVFFGSQTFVAQARGGVQSPWLDTFSVAFTCVAFWGIAAVLVARLARRYPLVSGRMATSVTVHVIAAFALSAIEVVLCVTSFWILWSSADTAFPAPRRLLTLFADDLHTNLIMYVLVLGLTRVFDLRRLADDRELRAARLEAELARARLETLEAQLQPHFLFNTLSSISVLMRHDVDAAESTLLSLADLLRSTLDNAGRHEVSLREELALTQCYLSIEQTRFQDRLVVEVDVDDDALDACVPTLLLQPLVENAIRHGIGARVGQGRVSLRATRQGGRLAVVVSDDGPGVPREHADPKRRPIGLVNTRARLSALYGGDHLLTLDSTPGSGSHVRVELPFRTEATR